MVDRSCQTMKTFKDSVTNGRGYFRVVNLRLTSEFRLGCRYGGNADETAQEMLDISEQTCFLHAFCRTDLKTRLKVVRV